MRLDYRLVNVFTRDGGRLTGNPLAVFEDGNGLDAATMQALALQFNLSETTFILPSDKADAAVRIFTPDYEMPFAGHPTLGTAHVVRSLKSLANEVTLSLQVGVIPVVADGDRWELGANAATWRQPQSGRAQIARALGLSEPDVGDGALWVNSGTEQLIVPLTSADAVKRVGVSAEALREVTRDGPRAQAYVFADAGSESLLSRFFFTKGGSIAEDPATGSATANLGGWYLARNAALPLTRIISQGEMAGRPSTLHLRIDADRRVFVAGSVVELGRGTVEL